MSIPDYPPAFPRDVIVAGLPRYTTDKGTSVFWHDDVRKVLLKLRTEWRKKVGTSVQRMKANNGRMYKKQPLEIYGQGEVVFDSTAEAARAFVLDDLLRRGAISDLAFHLSFYIADTVRHPTLATMGKTRFTMDFTYVVTRSGVRWLEDYKGRKAQANAEFKLRLKLLISQGGYDIQGIIAPKVEKLTSKNRKVWVTQLVTPEQFMGFGIAVPLTECRWSLEEAPLNKVKWETYPHDQF